MPLLFSYGTLQKEDVQRRTYGRVLVGRPDELLRFAPSLVEITDPDVVAALGMTHHANVVFNGDENSSVKGTVFEVTDAELATTDTYEGQYSYERVAAMLASGKRAWVYVEAK